MFGRRRVTVCSLLLALALATGFGVVGAQDLAVEGSDRPVATPANDSASWEDRSVWQRSYMTGLRSEGNQTFFGAARTDDGFLFVGSGDDHVGAGDPEVDSHIVETDESGDRIWGRQYSTFGTHHRVLHDATKLAERSYLLAGTIDGPSRFAEGTYRLREADRNVHHWDLRPGRGAFYDLLPGPDDGVVAVGSGQVIHVADPGNGTLGWRRHFDSITRIRAGAATTDGYVLAGTREPGQETETRDGDALSIDREGETRWQRSYPADGPARFRGVSDADDGLVFAGDVGPAGNRTAWVVGTDSTGDVAWKSRPLESGSTAHAVATGPGGRIVVAGRSPTAGGVVLVYDEQGQLQSKQSYGVALRDVVYAGDGTFVAVGATRGDGRDAFAVRIDTIAPRATMDVDHRTAEVGHEAVTLSANRSTDNYGLAAYRWDFDGDGTVDAVTNRSWTTHSYAEPGRVEPAVRVVDEAGLFDEAALEDSLDVRDTTPPRPELAHPAERFAARSAPTILDANASRDNHRIATYRWDFDGDGSVDRETDGPRVRHRFSGGNDTVRAGLSVVDPSGNENATVVPIEIRPNDDPELDIRESIRRAPDRADGYVLDLSATVANEVGTADVDWTLPNGTVVGGREVTIPLSEPEVTVRAVAEDEYGARASATATVEHPRRGRDSPRPDDGPPRRSALEVVIDVLLDLF